RAAITLRAEGVVNVLRLQTLKLNLEAVRLVTRVVDYVEVRQRAIDGRRLRPRDGCGEQGQRQQRQRECGECYFVAKHRNPLLKPNRLHRLSSSTPRALICVLPESQSRPRHSNSVSCTAGNTSSRN